MEGKRIHMMGIPMCLVGVATISGLVVAPAVAEPYPLTGNHCGPWLKRGATAIDSNEIAFIAASTFGEFGAGALLATSLNGPFATFRTLVSADTYAVADLAPLPDGRLLLLARPSNRPLATFGLYIYDKGETGW